VYPALNLDRLKVAIGFRSDIIVSIYYHKIIRSELGFSAGKKLSYISIEIDIKIKRDVEEFTMSSLGDRLNKFAGRQRFVVCRILLHLAGEEVAPLLGVLNQAGRDAIDSDGDLHVLGEGLVDLCQSLLQNEVYWQAAANEGDVFWKEEEAGNYVNELFTDSAQRYLSQPSYDGAETAEMPLSLPTTRHLVVMITIACEGEVPDLETDLADLGALSRGLKAIVNLHYQHALRAIQVHFSPARLGDELTSEQVLVNFPELIPL
jgi:Protein of unknown function (DUF1517)